MTHALHRVVEFSIVGPFARSVAFDDGTEQRIDCRSVLKGELFGPLRDEAVFNGVSLDTRAGALTWPNGADFDPTTLHDWPLVRQELASRADAWG